MELSIDEQDFSSVIEESSGHNDSQLIAPKKPEPVK